MIFRNRLHSLVTSDRKKDFIEDGIPSRSAGWFMRQPRRFLAFCCWGIVAIIFDRGRLDDAASYSCMTVYSFIKSFTSTEMSHIMFFLCGHFIYQLCTKYYVNVS